MICLFRVSFFFYDWMERVDHSGLEKIFLAPCMTFDFFFTRLSHLFFFSIMANGQIKNNNQLFQQKFVSSKKICIFFSLIN